MRPGWGHSSIRRRMRRVLRDCRGSGQCDPAQGCLVLLVPGSAQLVPGLDVDHGGGRGASDKKRAVLARRARNRRLYDAIDQWALGAINNSPGARAFYDQHRAVRDSHH